jgi:hypothetical protein
MTTTVVINAYPALPAHSVEVRVTETDTDGVVHSETHLVPDNGQFVVYLWGTRTLSVTESETRIVPTFGASPEPAPLSEQ